MSRPAKAYIYIFFFLSCHIHSHSHRCTTLLWAGYLYGHFFGAQHPTCMSSHLTCARHSVLTPGFLLSLQLGTCFTLSPARTPDWLLSGDRNHSIRASRGLPTRTWTAHGVHASLLITMPSICLTPHVITQTKELSWDWTYRGVQIHYWLLLTATPDSTWTWLFPNHHPLPASSWTRGWWPWQGHMGPSSAAAAAH